MSLKRGKNGTASCFYCIFNDKRGRLPHLAKEEQVSPLKKQAFDKKRILKSENQNPRATTLAMILPQFLDMRD